MYIRDTAYCTWYSSTRYKYVICMILQELDVSYILYISFEFDLCGFRFQILYLVRWRRNPSRKMRTGTSTGTSNPQYDICRTGVLETGVGLQGITYRKTVDFFTCDSKIAPHKDSSLPSMRLLSPAIDRDKLERDIATSECSEYCTW